jgi:hypothetical protein
MKGVFMTWWTYTEMFDLAIDLNNYQINALIEAFNENSNNLSYPTLRVYTEKSEISPGRFEYNLFADIYPDTKKILFGNIISSGGLSLTGNCYLLSHYYQWAENYFQNFYEKMLLPIIEQNSRENYKKKRQSGVTLNTEDRFKMFDKLKEENPTWTMEKVAREATHNLFNNGIVAYFTAKTVSTTFVAMGVKWPARGKRRQK